MKRMFAPLIGAVAVAVDLAATGDATPEQGAPQFDAYMQALRRNGCNVNPDTDWRVAPRACVSGMPGYIGWELATQGAVGPGAAL